jgi:hypothetical protein
MKAVRFHKTGGSEVLVYEDVPDLTQKDGEVLIRIEAVGLNFADVMRRRGDDYPDPSGAEPGAVVTNWLWRAICATPAASMRSSVNPRSALAFCQAVAGANVCPD